MCRGEYDENPSTSSLIAIRLGEHAEPVETREQTKFLGRENFHYKRSVHRYNQRPSLDTQASSGVWLLQKWRSP